jgi:hypothetical protein
MDYTLYTTVDITHTGQYRHEPGMETLRWKEQNFQTVLQTLGMRANVSFKSNPVQLEINGKVIGFNTSDIINVWRFNFSTEQDRFFEKDGNPVGYLIEDFDAVPYIADLDESMVQNYAVFVTEGKNKNIVFQEKQ